MIFVNETYAVKTVNDSIETLPFDTHTSTRRTKKSYANGQIGKGVVTAVEC